MNFLTTFSTCNELNTLKMRATAFVLISFLRNVELDHLVSECRVQTTHFNSQFPFENHFQEMRSGLEILRKKFNQIEINKRPGNLYCYT